MLLRRPAAQLAAPPHPRASRSIVAALAAFTGLAAASCSPWLLSFIPHASVECGHCGEPAIAGQPLTIDVSWPCPPTNQSDPQDRASAEKVCLEPFQVSAACEGVPCVVDQQPSPGARRVRITPTEGGRLVTHLTLKDQMIAPRTRTFGPFEVLKPDRLAIQCTARAPAGGPRVPCDPEVPAGCDVHLEITVHAGAVRLKGLDPLVRINGSQRTPGVREQGSPWLCATSIDAADGQGTTLKCVAYGMPAGEHDVSAEAGGLRSAIKVRVVGVAGPEAARP